MKPRFWKNGSHRRNCIVKERTLLDSFPDYEGERKCPKCQSKFKIWPKDRGYTWVRYQCIVFLLLTLNNEPWEIVYLPRNWLPRLENHQHRQQPSGLLSMWLQHLQALCWWNKHWEQGTKREGATEHGTKEQGANVSGEAFSAFSTNRPSFGTRRRMWFASKLQWSNYAPMNIILYLQCRIKTVLKKMMPLILLTSKRESGFVLDPIGSVGLAEYIKI